VSAAAQSTDRLSRVVARNSAAGMAAQLAIKVLSFAFSVLVVRQLGAEVYGQYAAVLAFGAIFVIFADLGVGVYAVRQVALLRGEPGCPARIDSLYANILGLRFVLSIGTAIAMVAAAWLTGRPPVFVLAVGMGAIGLIMYSVQGAAVAMLSGHERLDLSAGSSVVYQLTFVVVGASALLLKTGYYGLIVANLLGIAAVTAMCWTAAP
jgi:O-antigen/teichoic acid export membrane protein